MNTLFRPHDCDFVLWIGAASILLFLHNYLARIRPSSLFLLHGELLFALGVFTTGRERVSTSSLLAFVIATKNDALVKKRNRSDLHQLNFLVVICPTNRWQEAFAGRVATPIVVVGNGEGGRLYTSSTRSGIVSIRLFLLKMKKSIPLVANKGLVIQALYQSSVGSICCPSTTTTRELEAFAALAACLDYVTGRAAPDSSLLVGKCRHN